MPPEKTIKCFPRQKQESLTSADDSAVTVYAPQWVENMLPTITEWLEGCEVFWSEDSKFTISKENPVTLKMLQMISRNEKVNTTGKIPEQFTGLTSEQIYAIKDLIRHCVVVGTDKATKYGGYPIGSQSVSINPPQPTIICDLAALQFQQAYNSGRLVLIPVDDPELPKGELDDQIYQATVGESKKTAAEIKALREEKQKQQYPQVNCCGKQVYLDLNAYKKFVAKDFILAALTVAKQGKDVTPKDIWFNFLNYGTGFFVNSNNPELRTQLQINIYAGILEGLQELFKNNTLKEQLTNIKVFNFPYFKEKQNKEVQQIKKQINDLCNQNGKKASFEDCDALQPQPNGLFNDQYTLATTNCGDPHAMAGNEMNHGSVDAGIAENVAGNLNTFSAWLNTQMQEEYLPIPPTALQLKPEQPPKPAELPEPAKPPEPPKSPKPAEPPKSPEPAEPPKSPKPQPPAKPAPQPNLTIPKNIFNPDQLSKLLQEHYSTPETPTPNSPLPQFPPDPYGAFTYEDRANIPYNSNNSSFIGRIIHARPATQSSSKAGTTQTKSSTEKTTIANIFHESDQVILEFPPNPDGSIKPTQQAWIVNFLEQFLSKENCIQQTAAENQVPVATANGFKPQDLMNLLEKIHKINSNHENENKILLKIDCKDATEDYALVKHNIDIHNKNIETLINSKSTTGNSIKLDPLLKTLPNKPSNPSTGYTARP